MRSILRAVAAIVRRDIITERSYPVQAIVRATSLLVITTSLFYVSKLVHAPPELAGYQGGYFEYVVLGVALAWFSSVGLSSFGRAVSDELRLGTLESVLVSPAPVGAWLAGSLVVPFALAVLQITVYLASAVVLFGARFDLRGVPLALPFVLVGLGSFAALGILSGAFILLTKRGDAVSLLLGQLGTYFAGGLFPTTLLPGWAEAVTRAFPAYWALQGIRRALLGDAGVVDLLGPLAALAALTMLLLPVSVALFHRAVRAGRRTGTLATY